MTRGASLEHVAASTQNLAAALSSLTYEALPASAVSRAKALLLDFLGYTAAGRREPAHLALLTLLQEKGGQRTATALGHSSRLAPRDAALLNGATAHMRELDDTHRGTASHPGDSVFAATLAAAEEIGASGQTLLAAVVAGYEMAIRVGEALGPAHYLRGWHTSGTLNVFGAAAAAARLYGLDAMQTAHAIGLAGTQSCGSTAHLRTRGMAKDLNPGRAAEAGLLAAQLARLGFTGADDFLENPRGLALYGDIVRPDSLAGELRGHLRILEVGQKPWPGCRFLHPAIDAALALVAEHEIRARDVVCITARIFALGAQFVDDPEPWLTSGPYGPRFSAQYNIAYVLTHEGDLRGLFDDGHVTGLLDDPGFRALVRKIDVVHDRRLQETWPAESATELQIVTRAGVLNRAITTSKGEPENPLTEAELVEKFAIMTNGIYADAQRDRIPALALDVDQIEDVRQLMRDVRRTNDAVS